MKLVSYTLNGNGRRSIGSLEGESVTPIYDGTLLEYMEAMEAGEVPESGSDTFTSEEPKMLSLGDVRLHAPIQKPEKFIAIGLNYEDHAAETGAEIPEKPIVFAKYPNTIVGSGETVYIPPITRQADYEAELGVVIGREARNVPVERALDYVFGYVNCNDVSARDLQFSEGGQWTRSKSIDTFGPMGPYVATADEIPDPQNLYVRCILNGELVQDGTTSRMIFSVAELIAFLSTGMTLVPGDVISTGTPPGVGGARNPQLFLKNGDEMTVEIEGLGALTNPVSAGEVA